MENRSIMQMIGSSRDLDDFREKFERYVEISEEADNSKVRYSKFTKALKERCEQHACSASAQSIREAIRLHMIAVDEWMVGKRLGAGRAFTEMEYISAMKALDMILPGVTDDVSDGE